MMNPTNLIKMLMAIILTVGCYKHAVAEDYSFTISSQNIFICTVCEDIVREALAITGIDSEYKRYPSARALRLSNSGVNDGEVCRIRGAEKKYENLVMITPNITKLHGGVFVNKNLLKKRIRKWDDLKDVELGIRLGHLYSEKATEPFIQDKVTKVPTDKQLLDMLEEGHISAAVMILNDALSVVLNNPGHYQNIGIANPYLETLDLFFYINKKNVNLYEKVTSGIETVVDNGYAQKTYDDAVLKHKEILRKLIIE